jgi:hypothetical protein
LNTYEIRKIIGRIQENLQKWGIKLGTRVRIRDYFEFWIKWIRETKFEVPENGIACEGKNCKGFTFITHKLIVINWKKKGKGTKFKIRNNTKKGKDKFKQVKIRSSSIGRKQEQ